MKYRTLCWRVGLSIILSFVPLGSARAATLPLVYGFAATPAVFMTEVQTRSAAGASEEFIELYNATSEDIVLGTVPAGDTAWKLQYFSKSKLSAMLEGVDKADAWTSPYRTIALTGTIPAHDYFVVVATGYAPGSLEPSQTYTPTLADDGGALQLVRTAGQTVAVYDRLAWSNDAAQNNRPGCVPAPSAAESLQRETHADTAYINADGILETTWHSAAMTPLASWQPPAPAPDPDLPADTPPISPSDEESDTPTTPPQATPPLANEGLAPPYITELLPNPEGDETLEYIELYNPNDRAFNLRGYVLESGQTTLHDFTFTADVLLPPHSYTVFKTSETGAVLSNAGSQARLLNAAGVQVSETSPYGAAKPGQAWMRSTDGSWHWTLTATVAAENVLVPPAIIMTNIQKTAAKAVAAKTAVKGVASTSTKTKPLATQTAKKTTAKKTEKATAKPKTAATAVAPAAATTKLHPLVLAAVVLCAVGYGAYAYRKDLANSFAKLRRH